MTKYFIEPDHMPTHRRVFRYENRTGKHLEYCYYESFKQIEPHHIRWYGFANTELPEGCTTIEK